MYPWVWGIVDYGVSDSVWDIWQYVEKKKTHNNNKNDSLEECQNNSAQYKVIKSHNNKTS